MGTKKPETAWDTFATVQRNKARALRLKADAMERKLAARPPGNVVGAAEVIAKVLHFHGSSRAATQLMQMLHAIDYGDYNVSSTPPHLWPPPPHPNTHPHQLLHPPMLSVWCRNTAPSRLRRGQRSSRNPT